MHPNVFIDQLWRGTENDTVFVAMSFAPEYDERFHQVFRPAIEAAQYRGRNLTAVRVDESKSGDSIITEIVRGVCEARLVLVDVSAMPGFVGAPSAARNGNVMYELGLAHAVKSPARVLIVRDDSEKLLFDVTSIPHVQVDLSDLAAARLKVGTLLEDRKRAAIPS